MRTVFASSCFSSSSSPATSQSLFYAGHDAQLASYVRVGAGCASIMLSPTFLVRAGVTPTGRTLRVIAECSM